MTEARIDAPLVSRATAAVAARTFGGALLGLVLGVAAFAIAEWQGWLGASGARWLALPWDLIAGVVALGYAGWTLGKRRAARLLLIDSGVIGRLVRGADVEDRGNRLVRWARSLARKLIEMYFGPGQPAEVVTARVTEGIREWGRISLMIALVALAFAWSIPTFAD